MGMDVSGRDPDSEAGEYFHASVWSWRPIHELMYVLCKDLFDEETMQSMGFNDGSGPQDQLTCTQIADRFEIWLKDHPEGHSIEDTSMRCDKATRRFVTAEDIAANPGMETYSPYSTNKEHLEEWINFLRHCGGFRVH